MPPCRMAVHTERPLGPPPPREGRERERKRRKRGRSWSKQAAPTWTRCLTLDSAFPKYLIIASPTPPAVGTLALVASWGVVVLEDSPWFSSVLSLPLHSHKPCLYERPPAKTDLVTASPSSPFPSQPTHLRSSAALTPPHRISLFRLCSGKAAIALNKRDASTHRPQQFQLWRVIPTRPGHPIHLLDTLLAVSPGLCPGISPLFSPISTAKRAKTAGEQSRSTFHPIASPRPRATANSFELAAHTAAPLPDPLGGTSGRRIATGERTNITRHHCPTSRRKSTISVGLVIPIPIASDWLDIKDRHRTTKGHLQHV